MGRWTGASQALELCAQGAADRLNLHACAAHAGLLAVLTGHQTAFKLKHVFPDGRSSAYGWCVWRPTHLVLQLADDGVGMPSDLESRR